MDLDTISTLIAAISVIVGVIFASWQLRSIAKQRNIDFLYNLQSSMTNMDYRKAWKKIRDSNCKTYEEAVENCELEFELIIAYYENLGVLLKRGLIDRKIVNDIFGHSIIRAWERSEPYIRGARKEVGDEELYRGFEDLYKQTLSENNNTKKISEK